MVTRKVPKDEKKENMRRSCARLHRDAKLGFDALSSLMPQNEKPTTGALMFEALRRGVGKKPSKSMGRDGLIIYLMAQPAPPPLTEAHLAADEITWAGVEAGPAEPTDDGNFTEAQDAESEEQGAAKKQRVVAIAPPAGKQREEQMAEGASAISEIAGKNVGKEGKDGEQGKDGEAGKEGKEGKEGKTGKGAKGGKEEDEGGANWRGINGFPRIVNIIIKELNKFEPDGHRPPVADGRQVQGHLIRRSAQAVQRPRVSLTSLPLISASQCPC